MSVNIKIGGKTLNDITTVQFENADAPGTNIQFYDVNSVHEEKTVTPTTSVQEVVPSSGKLLSKVTVQGVTSSIDENIIPRNIRDGVTILGVSGEMKDNLPAYVEGNVTEVTEDSLYGVTSIRQYAFSYALANIEAESTVTIPNSVSSIGERAFWNSTVKRFSIDIGDGIQYIGDYAFSGNNLRGVYIRALSPPTLASDGAFASTNNCPIYVPTESVDLYKSATNWSALASRIQAIPEE